MLYYPMKKGGLIMRKSPFAVILVSAILAALCMTVRRFELFLLLDEYGLSVFTPLSVILALALVLAAVFFVLYAVKQLPKTAERFYTELFAAKTPVPLAVSLVGMLLCFVAAYRFFLLWKGGASVVLLGIAVLTALSGAAWVFAEFAAFGKNSASPAALLTAGYVMTLQPVCTVLYYYKKNAPEPNLLLVLYTFLALCAVILACYYLTGSTVRRTKPRLTLVSCGLAFVLCLTALIREQSLLYGTLLASYALGTASFGIRLLRAEPEP